MDEQQLSIVCVQVNDYLGRGVEYVTKLRNAVSRHMTMKYKFYCITDTPASMYGRGTVCKPAHPGLKGWWQKLYLFKKGMFPSGRVIFFDLDTIITNNIDFLNSGDGEFYTLSDFWNPNGLGPAVITWQAGTHEAIWNKFVSSGFVQSDPRGDQYWLEKYFSTNRPKILQEKYPNKFYSYKTSCTTALPESAAVVCFHGKPRPHEVGGWVNDHWR